MLTPGDLGILAAKVNSVFDAAANLAVLLYGEFATAVAQFESGEIIIKRFHSYVTLEIETVENDFGYGNHRALCSGAVEVYEALNCYFGRHADLDTIEWVARPAICLH